MNFFLMEMSAELERSFALVMNGELENFSLMMNFALMENFVLMKNCVLMENCVLKENFFRTETLYLGINHPLLPKKNSIF